MCGIAGILEADIARRPDPAVMRSMTRALFRRGPDDEGFFGRDNVALGMRRLAIIDVAGGRQPIANEDGTLWIVFNGEIFNHEELRDGLIRRGHELQTRSDTETILHLFEEEGPRCLDRLRGMFAIAIWNTRRRQLFIARDRLGIKPLHYFWDGRRLVFGSEIKALLRHPAVPAAIDWTAADAFFTYGYIPAPYTIYRDVRQLLPGHYMLADGHGLRQTRYWDLAFGPKLKGSDADFEDELVARLRESVRLRMLSEVPLGAYLSGGIDSGVAVAMMAETSERPVNTFTIGFGGETGNFFDERQLAREVSARLRTHHREFEVQPDVEEALDAALGAFDQPFADDSLVPTHHICRMARSHVTVALTGLGGDEGLAGYERYLGLLLSERVARRPWRWLLKAAAPAVQGLREQRGGHYRVNHLKRFMASATLPPDRRWQGFQAVFSKEGRRSLYQRRIAREIDFDAVDALGHQHFGRCDSDDPLDRALYQDIKMYLPDDILALTDRVGMWHSLELRVPLVDHTLLEFCARLPRRMKIRRGRKKYLLRKAARRFLPPSVVDHRKQGFAAPMAMWLRGPLRDSLERHLSTAAVAAAGVLQPRAVEGLLTAHRDRRSLNDKPLFAILAFQRWLFSRAAVTAEQAPAHPATTAAGVSG